MNTEPSKDWSVEFSEIGKKSLAKLDPSVQRLIRKTLTAIAATNQPRSRGKVLKGNLAGLWRYRIGDWRVIADIQDERLVIVAVDVGHRSKIYDD